MSSETQQKFYKLYNQYKLETMYQSSLDSNHPHLVSIMGMGKEIIPLLLSNLWDSWLPILVLPSVVGDTPFELLLEDHGRFDVISQKWYQWGEKEGYI